MDWQHVIDLALACAVGCLGWFMTTLWNDVQENKRTIYEARLDLANNYVKKDDFRVALVDLKSEITAGFNRLYDELKEKQDKKD